MRRRGSAWLLQVALVAAAGGGCSHPPEVTFNRDVAPIVFEHCSSCHRPGESAPFDLLTYDDVRRRGRQVAQVTRQRYMPPWLPEEGDYPFVGRRGLEEHEIATIRRWVEQGMPEGETTDLPPAPRHAEGWLLGRPDLIVSLPEPYLLAPEGNEVFRNFVIPIPVSRAHHVEAVELRPGNKRVVHHAVMAVDRTPASRRRDERDPGLGFGGMEMGSALPPDGHFLGWTPGKVPLRAPEGMAWRLAAGTDFVLQLHMVPTGKPEVIQPSVGFFFAQQPARVHPTILMLANESLDIPPGEDAYVAEDRFVLPAALDVLGVYPHAHYLGRDLWGYAILPGGERRTLLRIRDWDFNWQDEYRFAEPVSLPRGTTLAMRYTYDNSSSNVRNPNDPPVRVRFGPRSSDEMGTLLYQVLLHDQNELGNLELEKAKHALDRDPTDVNAWYNKGSALLAVGHLEEAVGAFEEALRLEPEMEQGHYNLGIALTAGGDLAGGIERFRRALELNPDLAAARNNLASALLELGRTDEAVEQLGIALTLQPDFDEAHYNLGNALLASGRPREAIAAFREALRINPDASMTHCNLGAALHSIGALDQAIPMYRRALELDPSNVEAHNNLGLALAHGGHPAEARRHFLRALELDARFDLARENLERLDEGESPE